MDTKALFLIILWAIAVITIIYDYRGGGRS